MDEETFVALITIMGAKIHDLTIGFASMFNLCVRHKVFNEFEFFTEKAKIESSPDLVRFRELLANLSSAKEKADFAKLLQEFEGPPQ